MALGHRASRFHGAIWPGFVDAMGALLMILFFVLSIFMILQYVLRDTISGQRTELADLSTQVATLGDALGLERRRADTQEALVATLTGEREAAEARIADFESQVAGLLARDAELTGRAETAERGRAEALSQKEALDLALARARTEVDAATEA
ncbi:MAG: peptidoglycan-binding protein, partial [Amaricoccus sp.]